MRKLCCPTIPALTSQITAALWSLLGPRCTLKHLATLATILVPIIRGPITQTPTNLVPIIQDPMLDL